jgi:hypothetical protein
MGKSKFKLHKLGEAPDLEPSTSAGEGTPSEAEALLSFAAESGLQAPPAAPAGPQTPRRVPLVRVALTLGATLTALAATVAILMTRPGTAAAPAAVVTGTASIESQPPGAVVTIDGKPYGTTPARLSLPTGAHVLELTLDGNSRRVPFTIEPGATVAHYIEFAAATPAAATTTGRLEVASDPAGAQISVDGLARGRTPLTIDAVQPGEHSVVITSGSTSVTRRVTVAAGNTAALFASLTKPDAGAGWVTFRTPIEFQIYNDKKLVGTTAAEQLMLPAGRHELELVNSALEFRRVVSVQIGSGTTVNSTVDLPNGSLSISALPWADVWIDGRAHGTTPLGNVSVPIGTHEILWRHPQLGERRRSVNVPASSPVRVGVDFNQ